MFKGGRPGHPIWEYFHRVTVDGKVHDKCKICGHQQAPLAERTTSHQCKIDQHTILFYIHICNI